MNSRPLISVFLAFMLTLFSIPINAQINRGQQVPPVTGPPGSNITNQRDTTEEDYSSIPRTPPFTIKRYFKSLAHKDTMNISQMFFGSIILPGTAQIYNRQYWKLPVIYGAMGTFAYAGYSYNIKWLDTGETNYKNYRNMLYAGALLTWWGSMADGVANFKSHKEVLPARASLYSVLLPGLGQIYNGDYWKLPIIYGGFITCAFFINFNNAQFKRYSNLFRVLVNPDPENPIDLGNLTSTQVSHLRDSYRRYRDYSVLATLGVYAFNIIDANISAHMSNFDVSEDLSASISPGIITPINTRFAFNTAPAFGLNLKLKF
jgi:hypothetical protein